MLVVPQAASHASVLNWASSSISYSAGATSTTYNNVNGSGVNITVTLSWDNTYNNPNYAPSNPNPFNNSYPNGNPQYPQITDDYTGGQGGNAESLLLRVPSTSYVDARGRDPLGSGFADEDSVLYVTFTFSSAVEDVNFSVFDVDYAANDYQDLVTVTGSYYGSGVAAPDTSNSGQGASNQVTAPGQVLGTGASNGDSSAGNAYFDFDDTQVTSITVAYGNGNQAPTYPDGQAIAIGNIFFTAVPEADAAWSLIPVGLLVGATTWLRRRRGNVCSTQD